MAEDEDRRKQPPQDYPAEKARQGEIILRSRRRRAIFIAGLAGLAVVALLGRLCGGPG